MEQISIHPCPTCGGSAQCIDGPDGKPVHRAVRSARVVEHGPNGLTFSEALIALKRGQRVQRAGWNGKNMYLFLARPERISVQGIVPHAGDTEAGLDRAKLVSMPPAIVMRTATGDLQMGWLAAQPDMLADDWVVLP